VELGDLFNDAQAQARPGSGEFEAWPLIRHGQVGPAIDLSRGNSKI
jgi:hypothetical protein